MPPTAVSSSLLRRKAAATLSPATGQRARPTGVTPQPVLRAAHASAQRALPFGPPRTGLHGPAVPVAEPMRTPGFASPLGAGRV